MSAIAKILWILLCVCLTVDTGRFVYVSLSQTLLGGLLILVLVGSLCLSLKSRTFILSRVHYLVLMWIVYLACFSAFALHTEIYKLLYLEETFLLLISLPFLISNGLFTKRTIENGLIVMACIQIGCLLLQSIGLLSSYNSYFHLTGFCENPNVTAILLAVTIPLVFKRMKSSSYKSLWAIILILSAVFILILKCRTAYIGLATIFIVRFVLSDQAKVFWTHSNKNAKIIAFTISSVLILLSGLVLYRTKQASADGRLLVWKVSAMMIQENPLGVGIGMFEHDYNLKQGDYLERGSATEEGQYNSGTVYMAYNDFIEHTVEAGIPGLLFLLVFYIGTIIKAYRNGNIEALSIIVAFFVMSFTNFIYSSIQPWIVLIAYTGIALSSSEKQTEQSSPSIINKLTPPIIATGCMALLWIHTPLLYSQIKLNQYQQAFHRGESIDLSQADALAKTIGTSEAYYRFMYEVYMNRGMYDEALLSICKAKQYTSTPDVFFSLFDCYDKMGKTEEGIPYIVKVTQMLPQNLTSRLVLLKWFDSQGAQKEAIRIATEIAQTPIKIHNQRSDDIIHYARTYLQKHQSKLLISK